MEPLWWVTIFLVVLLLATGAAWAWQRANPPTDYRPAPGIAEMGYGTERWERERTLWRGVLRRLEIQARYTDSIPERLQREIAEAKTHIAEAEQHLSEVQR